MPNKLGAELETLDTFYFETGLATIREIIDKDTKDKIGNSFFGNTKEAKLWEEIKEVLAFFEVRQDYIDRMVLGGIDTIIPPHFFNEVYCGEKIKNGITCASILFEER
jgi:hypothetical protein